MMNDLLGVLTLFFTLAGLVVVALFLVLRWFMLWYWKVDEQVELLRHIAKHIQLLEERDRAFSPPPWAPTGDRVPTARG
jgi:hypothetical protein